MIRFIWQNWWRHKERLILLLVGILIVGSGLSYLVGMAQASRGTIMNQLEKRWSASYDIVVRPQGTRSVTENKKLLEPNYLSGISGGISLDQYHQIQKIDGIQVAAPIAMIGYISYYIPLEKLTLQQKGVYRLKMKEAVDIGPRKNVQKSTFYFSNGDWSNKDDPSYGVSSGDFSHLIETGATVLLAGIDPKEENALVGLKDSVSDQGNSRYFEKMDAPMVTKDGKLTDYHIPVLVNDRSFVKKKDTFTIERLNLPFQNDKIQMKTMEKVKKKGGKKYLNTVQASMVHTYTFTADQAHNKLMEQITGLNPKTGKPAVAKQSNGGTEFHWMTFRPTPLKLNPVSSPFIKRWPYAYETKISHHPNPVLPSIPKNTYRAVHIFGKNSDSWPRIDTSYIGTYNPGKLNIAQNPLTELPMETYSPASAHLVLNSNGKPINPPTKISPSDSPYGFLTKPPGMLTTIKAAAKILGKKPISAIRIKVAGVTNLDEKSQKKLEKIASEIRNQTGLDAEITLGSSPQPALTHIPAKGNQSALGWIQQPWVKLGSSFAIFKETKVGFSGVVGSVMLVAIIYVFASLLVSLFARRREFAVLLAIGWRPSQLSKMIFLEAGILGTFVAIIAWGILSFVLSVHQTQTSFARIILSGLFGFVIYGMGAIIPAFLARRIRPYEALQSGEISRISRRFMKIRTIFSLSFSYLLGRWRRSLLSVFAIAVPTSLLAFFLFVTFRLSGVMYTTWLGQYVALKVGPQHYVAMAVALLIAILTTAEVMWQNISERQPEIALLKSVGWQNRSVRILVLLEGGFTGLVSAVIGLVIAFGIIWGMYQQFPIQHLGFLLATGVIPIVIGFIGAMLPAEKAVRIIPSQGVRGQYANLKKTEKRFRIGLGVVAAMFVVGFLIMMFTTVPTVKPQHTEKSATQEKVVPTSGKVDTKKASKPSNEKKKQPHSPSTYKRDFTAKIGKSVKVHGSLFEVDQIAKTLPAETKRHFKVNDIKLKKGMKFVALKVTYQNQYDVPSSFTPLASKMITKGKSYQAMYFSGVDGDESWVGGRVKPNQKIEMVITYQIPKDSKNVKTDFYGFPQSDLNVEVSLKK